VRQARQADGDVQVRQPCTECPPGAEKRATFDDKGGSPNKLCGKHGKLAKTSRSYGLCPGPDCPSGSKAQASYPGRPGEKPLCGPCARRAGTYTVLKPCTKCPVGTKQASFMDEDGIPNLLCEMHAREAGTYQRQKRPQCANCSDNAYRRFSAESSKYAGERACLACLVCLDNTHPAALRREREFKCIGAIVHLVQTVLGRPDIANAIQELGANDCAEGPIRRRGDQVFRIIRTLIGQIEVDEDNHLGYTTSCETAKVAGHIADRNGINPRPVMDSDADENLAQLPLIDNACHPGAGTQVVNTHVWRVDTTGAFKFHSQHRAW